MSPGSIKTAILGDGEFGEAAGQVLPQGGGRLVRALGAPLPGVEQASSVEEAVAEAGVVVLCSIAADLVELLHAYGPHATADQVVLLTARGVLAGFELPHATVRRHTCIRKIGVVGGPLHAQDLATNQHVNLVLATRFPEVWRRTQAILPERGITVGRSHDLVGVAVAGVYGHLTSMLCGLAEGLEWAETPRSMLIAHLLADARRLAVALGAEPETFQGLVGWGELIPRASARSDRHHHFGAALARGLPVDGALAEIHEPIQGIDTAREALQAARMQGLELPLTRTLVELLDGASDPQPRLQAILAQPLVA